MHPHQCIAPESYCFLLVMFFSGEWEISAFDGSLKSRGMSIYYSVRSCDNGDLPLVSHDRDEDDISDYIDQLDLLPRGTRPRNHTVIVRVCEKALTNNNTQSVNTANQNVTDERGDERQSGCKLKKVTLTSQGEPTLMPEERIPEDILEEIAKGEERMAAHNGTGYGEERVVRERRQAEGKETDVDMSSGALQDEGAGSRIGDQSGEERTITEPAQIKAQERKEMSSINNGAKEDLEESIHILLKGNPLVNKTASTGEPTNSEDLDYVHSEPEKLKLYLQNLVQNYTAVSNNISGIGLSMDYDDYREEVLFSAGLCDFYIY